MKKAALYSISAMFALFLLLWVLIPIQNSQDRIETTLQTVGGYRLPNSEGEKQFYKNVLLYKQKVFIQQKPISLIILDATHNRHVVHDPLFCFQGAGWRVTEKKEVQLPHNKGAAKLIYMSRGNEKKEFLYWFSDRKSCFHSFLTHWLKTTWRRLSFGLLSDEPLLIFLEKSGLNAPEWETILEQLPDLFTL